MIVYTELATVERELGISARTLYALSNNIDSHYRTAHVPRRAGDVRNLSVPDKLLKTVQRRIAQRLLAYEEVSKYAKAYKIASGVVPNARPHVGAPMVLKLDIRHFFDSILYSHVKERAFPSNKYSEKIRVLLSLLCYYKDCLPQGAPTSPVISNIVMCEFDDAVGAFCEQRNISYTRYSDDMTFSGDFDAAEVTEFVAAELAKYGFFLNNAKSTLVSKAQRQTVTGIVVNNKLSCPREYKRKIRQEVYYCQKYSVEEHLKKSGTDLIPKEYLSRLLGRISYALMCEPADEELCEYKRIVIGLIKDY